MIGNIKSAWISLAALVPLVTLLPVNGQSTGDNYHAPNVLEQFQNLAEQGDPVAVHVGVGLRDYGPAGQGRPCKHYQGLARGSAADGTPYFFFTRSRNRSNACCEIWYREEPGELLIVRMESTRKDGERLRSNRLKHGRSVDKTAPPENDIGVKAIYFDGMSTDQDGDIWPLYWHPGGTQLIDNILVVPLECSVGSNCLDPLDCDGNESGLAIIDVSTPEEPDLLLHQPLPELDSGFGVVGVTKVLASDVPPGDPRAGRYLFVYAWGDSRMLRFGFSDTDDLRTTKEVSLEPFYWLVYPQDRDWNKWQTLNFIRGTDGKLYLLGADNSTSAIYDGEDWLSLLQVDVGKLNSVDCDPVCSEAITWPDWPGKQLTLAYHLRADVADLGDLDAASGAYVSPTGQLIFYAAHFTDSGGEGDFRFIEMGEFRNIEVSHTGTCGLQLSPSLGGPYEINEGDSLWPDPRASYVEPWVHMFAETGFRDRSLMMDWIDQRVYPDPGSPSGVTFDASEWKDNHWIDFPQVGGQFTACGLQKSGFNDTLKSFTFCGSVGSELELFDDDSWNCCGHSPEIYPMVEGTGEVNAVPDVGSSFRCEATSARIVWSRPKMYEVEVEWGEGEPESSSVPSGSCSDNGASCIENDLSNCDDPDTADCNILQPYFDLNHVYGDDDPTGTPKDEYTITVTEAENWINSVSTTVTVHNVDPAPTIDRITDQTGARIGVDVPVALVELEVDVSGSFIDPGTRDTHTATISWGDGTIKDLGDVVGTATDRHKYSSPGDYTITLAVTDDDLGQGVATAEITVVRAYDALFLIMDLLGPLASDRDIANAMAKLGGSKGGQGQNGAVDLLAKGNLNASLEQIKTAMRYLEAADPGLDLTSIKGLLALTAKSIVAVAIVLIEPSFKKPNDQRKLKQARRLLAQGDTLLAGSQFVGAVDRYQQAMRWLQGN